MRDALVYDGDRHRVPATQLKRAMDGRRGFTRAPGDLYNVGRPPRLTRAALE
ncbi:hypothetical protein GXW83_15550 [Streptacidiphilus sp. PB12-B1b]|uniref:hypothetical protein n=1 Tax=Streptacidiphilus sp. PB12-B1b TaxID=2705012 RepID=UPI0015FC8FAB|nr:hypothetical protein [Streptacidiphilus sp. PB12-B1b]QMU76924.1 hypothetical protein GXW83_15550 [Streptacidiphilus sp. PB12-B1b]